MKRFLIILAVVLCFAIPFLSDAFMQIEGASLLGTIRTGGWPTAVQVSSRGYVYVGLSYPGYSRSTSIYVYDPSYKRVMTKRMDGMTGFTLDDNDYIYVANNKTKLVGVYSPNGNFIRNLFTEPIGSLRNVVWISQLQELHVLVLTNNKDYVYNKSGTLLRTIDVRGRPYDVTYANELLHYSASGRWQDGEARPATTYNNNTINLQKIHIITPQGEFLGYGGAYPAGMEGNLISGKGITSDIEGNIYIAESWSHVVMVYDPDGNYLGAIKASPVRKTILDTYITPNKILYTAGSREGIIYVHKIPWGAEPVDTVNPPVEEPPVDVGFILNHDGTLEFDNSQVTYYAISTDGGKTYGFWLTGNGGKTVDVSGPDGDRTVCILYQDINDNQFETCDTITIDTTPPPVPVISGEEGITWTYDAEENVTFELQIADNPTFDPSIIVTPEEFSWVINEYGTWYWRILVIDSAGNKSDWSDFEMFDNPEPEPPVIEPEPEPIEDVITRLRRELYESKHADRRNMSRKDWRELRHYIYELKREIRKEKRLNKRYYRRK